MTENEEALAFIDAYDFDLRQMGQFEDFDGIVDIIRTALKQVDKAQVLVEALEFYSKAWVNQSNGSADGNPSKRLIADKGDKAHQALAAYKENV